jgi:hypothetical protein
LYFLCFVRVNQSTVAASNEPVADHQMKMQKIIENYYKKNQFSTLYIKSSGYSDNKQTQNVTAEIIRKDEQIL